jgi:hypothetical protein
LTDEEYQELTSKIATELENGLQIAKYAFKYNEGLSRDRELARTLCCDILMTGEKADIDDAYKVHQWVINGFKLYALNPLPEKLEEITALQREVETTKPPGVRMEQFMHSAVSLGTGRSVCATARGDLGRVPFGALSGDLVCVFKGGIVPYLLREEGARYKLVGECYINGIMYGEALGRQDLVCQEFKIQ